MFAIASSLYRGSTVVEWQLVYNQLVHPGGMMRYVCFNWQPDHFSLRKMNLQAEVKKKWVWFCCLKGRTCLPCDVPPAGMHSSCMCLETCQPQNTLPSHHALLHDCRIILLPGLNEERVIYIYIYIYYAPHPAAP